MISGGNITVINDMVYFGGGATSNLKFMVGDDDDECVLYCYDPPQDKWTTLPPLPVRWFYLGQVNGKLVTVGGAKKSGYEVTNELYTYHEQRRKWMQTIPPMPTARHSPGILSLQSALIVAGGYTKLLYTAAVEIFKSATSQWYKTDPLPTVCRNLSLIAIDNTCYALGGYKLGCLNQALYASVDDLLDSAIPPNQTTHSGNMRSASDTQSSWKMLPNIPSYRPAAAVLAGKLLVIGGSDASKGGTNKAEVYLYSPSTNSWVYISDLPAPRFSTAAAVLSSTEILVVGGWDDGGKVNTVYKGTLILL